MRNEEKSLRGEEKRDGLHDEPRKVGEKSKDNHAKNSQKTPQRAVKNMK